MISLYCDEDVDILIKPLLEAKGFNVLTTLDEGMLGTSDIQRILSGYTKESIKNQLLYI